MSPKHKPIVKCPYKTVISLPINEFLKKSKKLVVPKMADCQGSQGGLQLVQWQWSGMVVANWHLK